MKKVTLLILGDVLALAVITLIGFGTHDTLIQFPVGRIMATFLPLFGRLVPDRSLAGIIQAGDYHQS